MYLLSYEHKMLSMVKIRKIGLFLLIVVIFDLLLFFAAPHISEASDKSGSLPEIENINLNIGNSTPALKGEENIATINRLPESPELKVKWAKKYQMTAYNSEVAQCDDSPCITANGFNVCEHGIEDTLAANFLPFGTKIRIPELFGDRIFTVRDRMNSRYTARVDVWLKSKQNAIDFGLKYAEIQVME